MNKTPFFSVIIPTYNPPDLIFRTLESVFGQTFTDFEILVVDDCSPQDSRAKLGAHIDSGRIRFIRNEKNGERAVTRNHGLRECRGQWVTFLDHDDLMYPNCLEDAHRFISQNPDYQFVHNLNEMIDPEGRPLKHYRAPLTNDPSWDLVNGNFLACIGAFVRRDAFEKTQFDETRELLWSEDYEYWLRLLAVTGKMGRIHKINSGIVEHPARTVHKIALEKSVTRARHIVEKVRRDPVFTTFYPPAFIRRFEAVRWLLVAISYETAGQYHGSAGYLMKALRADPTVLTLPLYLRSLVRMPFRALTRGLKA